MIAIQNEQNFKVNRLEYLEGAMTLYDTYSAGSIDEIVDSVRQLHRNIT